MQPVSRRGVRMSDASAGWLEATGAIPVGGSTRTSPDRDDLLGRYRDGRRRLSLLCPVDGVKCGDGRLGVFRPGRPCRDPDGTEWMQQALAVRDPAYRSGAHGGLSHRVPILGNTLFLSLFHHSTRPWLHFQFPPPSWPTNPSDD